MNGLTEIIGACGHIRRAVISNNPMQALKEVEQLANGDCAPCVKAERQRLGYVASGRMCWPGVR